MVHSGTTRQDGGGQHNRPVPQGEPELISIAEAQTEFGVGRTTLYRLISEGLLTVHTRRGSRVRTLIDRRQLRAVLAPRPRGKRR
jgi:hypothetical protein